MVCWRWNKKREKVLFCTHFQLSLSEIHQQGMHTYVRHTPSMYHGVKAHADGILALKRRTGHEVAETVWGKVMDVICVHEMEWIECDFTSCHFAAKV